MVRTVLRSRRFVSYRPLVELLEDRLPPGDAVLGALLAWRAAGLVPAVWDAPPTQAAHSFPRAQALPGHASLEALPPERGEMYPTIEAEPRGWRAQAEPGHEETTANRRLPLPRPDDGGIANPGPMSSAPFALGTPSAFHSTVFVTPPPANYQLDQAVAALVPPTGDDGGAGIQSSGVHPLFNLDHPDNGPFPSNVFTVPDRTMNTNLRINLPFPDCKVYVSDCEDLAVLNELDGFNLQPRLSVPFSGPIDVDTATSETVFLISLGSTVPGQGYMPRGTVVGINQIVWDVETNTLHVESDELLAQHTRFALIVTNGVRDADGEQVEASEEFRRFRQTVRGPYKQELLDAVHEARRLGVRERDIVTASVFTTQSATAVLEKIRDQIKAQTPKPADFLLGEKGERTVFPFTEQSSIFWQQHRGVDPPTFVPQNFTLAALRVVPGVGQLAFGKFLSPDYMVHPGEYIPAVGTRTGVPDVYAVNEIYFNLIVPSGPKPAEGWPVAIYGLGAGGNKQTFSHGAVLASQGVATIMINSVGHGYGPLGTLTVNLGPGQQATLPAGGRGFDQNGDGMIGDREGISATPPRGIQVGRDGTRQTVVDLMQLVRVIEVGMDMDGDAIRDLDPSRVYYFGASLGGMFGTQFLAVEPGIRAGVLNVARGAFMESTRLSPSDRGAFIGTSLANRVPSLVNLPGITMIDGVPVSPPYFDENKPLRNQPPVTNTVAGAMAIQVVLENTEWAMGGESPAYAPHLRRAPLAGVPAKSVIYQVAKGDQGATNPATTAILRAGTLADRTTFYRHDLAFAEDPTLPKNPHGFLGSITSMIPLYAQISRGAQEQVAAFFASDGKTIIHPEPARFFEVPIQGPLPEELNYIP